MDRKLPAVTVARESELGDLRRRIASGELTRVRRGGYVVGPGRAPTVGGATPAGGRAVTVGEAGRGLRDAAAQTEAALAHAAVVHRQLQAPHVFSHDTAALLWGFPLWAVPGRTHVRQVSSGSGTGSRDIARHVGLPTSHALIQGIPVTTLEQTVLDCLVTMPPLDALVVADAALRQGVRVDDVAMLVAARRQRRGTTRAAHVLSLADAGAASAWESWLRYLALHAGLPRPITQWRIQTHAGRFDADLAWPEHQVLAEFDGAIKYADGAFGAEYSGRRALVEEKRREDAIAETLGVRPVRFTAKDAARPEVTVQRLLSRFPPAFRATLRPNPRLPLPRPAPA